MRVYSKHFKKALPGLDYKKLDCPLKLFDFVLLFAGLKTRRNTYWFYNYYKSFDFYDEMRKLQKGENITLEEYFKESNSYVKHKSNVLLFWLTPNLLWYSPKAIYAVLGKKKSHRFESENHIRNRFENGVEVYNERRPFSQPLILQEKDFIDPNDPEILLLKSISSV
jgi:hypothetical protein